jgi:hypothetical protein
MPPELTKLAFEWLPPWLHHKMLEKTLALGLGLTSNTHIGTLVKTPKFSCASKDFVKHKHCIDRLDHNFDWI